MFYNKSVILFILLICRIKYSGFNFTSLNNEPICALAEPPVDLNTGSLDQLVNGILKSLFIEQSVIQLNQSIEIFPGFEVNNISVYGLNSIQLSCPIKLITRDKLGCYYRGLILDTCLGFEKLQLNFSIKTILPGFEQEDLHLTVYSISVKIILELLSYSRKIDFSPTYTSSSLLPSPTSSSLSSASNHISSSSVLQSSSSSIGRLLQFRTIRLKSLKLKSHEQSYWKSFILWFINFFINSIKGLLIKRLDRIIINVLNDQIMDLHLTPLFISNDNRITSMSEDVQKSIQTAETNEKQLVVKSKSMPASPIVG
ncbi:unnamed protein product [Trichobilharzia szidati]|nr:unnamed protein product [Trichobilharzia szidati]